MSGNWKFICRKRKQKYSEDVTWLNTDRMPYYNSATIKLYASGESVLEPGYRLKSSPMVYWAVEYVCEGDFLVTRGENRYRLTAGDVLIMYPGFHYIKENRGNVPVRKKEIMLNNSPLLSICCHRSELNGREIIHCSDPAAAETYFDRIRELVTKPDEAGDPDRLLPNTVFSLFTELIAQCREKSGGNPFYNRLKRLNVLSPGLTAKRMAEHFEVGERTLTRMFRKELNCSPCEYLISARMVYASQLLRSNTLSIKNIAEECGYRNTSFFIAKFKQYFSRTPLEYRKELGIFDDLSLRSLDAWTKKTRRKPSPWR